MNELEKRFMKHEEKQSEEEKVRKAALEFARIIEEVCPNGREKSLVYTNLEQAMLWAVEAIRRNS